MAQSWRIHPNIHITQVRAKTTLHKIGTSNGNRRLSMSPHAVTGFPSGFWSGLERKLYIKGLSQKPRFIQPKARIHTSQPTTTHVLCQVSSSKIPKPPKNWILKPRKGLNWAWASQQGTTAKVLGGKKEKFTFHTPYITDSLYHTENKTHCPRGYFPTCRVNSPRILQLLCAGGWGRQPTFPQEHHTLPLRRQRREDH